MVDVTSFEFLDLGCSTGGSIDMCLKRFNASSGLGVDFDLAKVKAVQERGYSAIHEDVLLLQPSDKVRFVSMVQFLEHLPNINIAQEVIRKACSLATDFIYIHHPSFEDIGYLDGYGLKLYYNDWTGHKAKLLITDIVATIMEAGTKPYFIRNLKPIFSSDHPAILPSSAPVDQHYYDPSKHGWKPKVKFDRPIYQHYEIFVPLKEFEEKEWLNIIKPYFKD